MLQVEIVDMTSLVAFWLCFTRWSAVMVQLPLFDNTNVPSMIKVLASLVISYAFFPFVKPSIVADIQYMGGDAFWILTIFYMVTGIAMGFFVKAIMLLFTSAGSIITQQVGFGAVRYFDPQSGQQIGPFEKLISLTILVLVISSGALIPMFKGVFSSFSTVHVYDWGKMANAPEFYFHMFKSLFLSALMLASPLIFINMMVMTILGIIARTVPQMNILMVSFVVNIGLGLLVFVSSSDEFFHVAFKVYTERLGEWFQMMT